MRLLASTQSCIPSRMTNARNLGRNGLERATNLFGRIRLQIKHIKLRRTAGQKEHYDRPGPGGPRGSRRLLQAKQAGESQVAQAERTDPQQFTPRPAVAVTNALVDLHAKHGSILSRRVAKKIMVIAGDADTQVGVLGAG